jgi:hypothetical protein
MLVERIAENLRQTPVRAPKQIHDVMPQNAADRNLADKWNVEAEEVHKNM